MKIFVAGSTGRVATELLKKLSAKNYQVIAGSRRPEAVVELPNVMPQKMNLHASVDNIAELLKGADVVVFAAGSRGKDLLQTDAYGAVKLIQAAQPFHNYLIKCKKILDLELTLRCMIKDTWKV